MGVNRNEVKDYMITHGVLEPVGSKTVAIMASKYCPDSIMYVRVACAINFDDVAVADKSRANIPTVLYCPSPYGHEGPSLRDGLEFSHQRIPILW